MGKILIPPTRAPWPTLGKKGADSWICDVNILPVVYMKTCKIDVLVSMHKAARSYWHYMYCQFEMIIKQLIITQQNSYSISHLLGRVTTQWLDVYTVTGHTVCKVTGRTVYTVTGRTVYTVTGRTVYTVTGRTVYTVTGRAVYTSDWTYGLHSDWRAVMHGVATVDNCRQHDDYKVDQLCVSHHAADS